jgi:hypothetical protein
MTTMPETQTKPAAAPSLDEDKPSRRFDRLRLLPVLMIVATLSFGVKVGDIWTDADAIVAGIPVAMAKDELTTDKETKDAPPADAVVAKADAGAEQTPQSPASTGDAGKAELDASQPYSRGELQLLENLSDRRAELDKRAQDIEMRGRVLDAMEQRIDGKISEM